jgi:hypothetical protein
MADEKASIKISSRADTGAILRTIGSVKGLRREIKGLSKDMLLNAAASKLMGSSMGGAGKQTDRWRKVLDSTDKIIRKMGAMTMKSLVSMLKMATIQMAALGAAMIVTHGAFIVGRFAMKTYQVAMQGLAATAAGFTTAVSIASAAVREQQAAMYAYKTKTAKEFGSGLNQTRMVMRNLTMDADLAVLGVENLNKAFATVSKNQNVTFNATSQKYLKGLMDFASAGQPLEQGVEKAAELVATLQDSKKSYAQVKTAAKELGPAMVEAIKQADKQGINTKEKFIAAMNSGKLSALGGVTGQFDAINSTLFSQFKKYFSMLRGNLADFGQGFLGDSKVALESMYKSVDKALRATSGSVAAWGKNGGLLGALTSAVEKLSEFYVRLIRDYLPKSVGMFKRLGEWWYDFKAGFKEITYNLKPLIEGAKVLEKFFGAMFKPVWREIKAATNGLNSLLGKQGNQFEKFGAAVGELIGTFIKFFSNVGGGLVETLSKFTTVVNFLTDAFQMFADVFGGMQKMFGSQGAFFAMMAGARGMKTNFGGYIREKTQYMNVDAGTVNIKGAAIGAAKGFITGGPHGAAAGALAGSGVLGKAGPLVGTVAGGAGGLFSARGMYNNFSNNGLSGGLASMRQGAVSAVTGIPASVRASINGRLSSATAGIYDSYKMGGLQSARQHAQGLAKFKMSGLASTGPGFGSMLSRFPTLPGVGPGGPSSPLPGAPGGPGGSGGGGAGGGGGRWRYGSKTKIPGSQVTGWRKMTGRMFREARQRDADKAENRKGLLGGGIGSFATSMALGALGGKASPELQGGLNLAAMASMYSPKLGIGLAGGTLAMKSGNTAVAAGGGALAGAMLGKQLGGAPGMIVGAALGTAMGAIMAPITKARAESKKIKASVDEVMDNVINDFMVKAALLTRTGRGESENLKAMKQFASQARGRATDLNTRGQAQTKVGNRRGIGNMLLSGGGIGAAAGATVGAYLGSVLPIAGTIAGAAIGGIVGGIAGAAGGAIVYGAKQMFDLFGKRQRDKATRKSQKSELVNMLQRGEISQAQFDEYNKNDNTRGTALKRFADRSDAQATAAQRLNTVYERRTKVIADMTGLTGKEIDRLAMSMGVNLYDATKDFNEVLVELGVTVVKTAEQINMDLNQAMVNNLSVFDEVVKRQKAPLILDEAAKAFSMNRRAAGGTGPIDMQELGNFMKVAAEQMNIISGGDTMKTYFELRRQFGEGGKAFTQKGGTFEGLGTEIYAPGSASRVAMNDFFTKQDQSMQSALKGQFTARMAEQGIMLGSGGVQSVADQFGKLDLDTQQALANAISSGELFKGPSLSQTLGTYGVSIDQKDVKTLETADKAFYLADLTEKQALVADEQRKLIEEQRAFYSPESDQRPEWWSKEALTEVFKAAGINDTFTPRGKGIGDTTSSRLVQTLSRHNMMNAGIAGKRTVTSSYRNYGLGSINSDHVTGRAYDLVGNQLGMYKTTVERNGGFAEFHGGSQNRHLHVVPGPIGDTSVPSMTRPSIPQVSTSNSGRSGGNTININVSGGNTEQIVQQVKAHLDRINREEMYRR